MELWEADGGECVLKIPAASRMLNSWVDHQEKVSTRMLQQRRPSRRFHLAHTWASDLGSVLLVWPRFIGTPPTSTHQKVPSILHFSQPIGVKDSASSGSLSRVLIQKIGAVMSLRSRSRSSDTVIMYCDIDPARAAASGSGGADLSHPQDPVS